MGTTKAHFAAIGRISYEWSRLESLLQSCIAEVAGLHPQIGLILTNGGSVRSWTEILTRLVKHAHCSKALCERTKKLSDKIADKLYPARNVVIHGVWEMSWSEVFGDRFSPLPDQQAFVNAVKKSGKHMHVGARVNAAQLEELADKIKGTTLDLQQLMSVSRSGLFEGGVSSLFEGVPGCGSQVL
jgi:hypothetical protein